MAATEPSTVRHRAILVVALMALISFWTMCINDAVIDKDGGEILQFSWNLARTGVIAGNESTGVQPSMYREPLPVLAGAVVIRAIEFIAGSAESTAYFSGERARLIKYQNIVWMALLSVAVFMTARYLGLTFYPALLCVVLTGLLPLDAELRVYLLNGLYPEASAMALFTAGSLFLALGMVRGSAWRIGLAGFCFGLLALVHAVLLFVVAALVAISGWAWLQGTTPRAASWRAALLAGAACLVVVPWMLRNYLELDTFGIASGVGEMFYGRAVMDQMSGDEYRGAYYLWVPFPFNAALRRLLGYSRADTERNGRLQRLNDSDGSSFAAADNIAEHAGRPEDAVSYYRRYMGERVGLVTEAAAAGSTRPRLAADHAMESRALALIAALPWRHAALTLPFLLRGAVLAFPVLLVALIQSCRQRRQLLQLTMIPAMVLILFYSLFTSFMPRYSMPAYPIVLCIGVVLGEQFRRWSSERWRIAPR